METLKLTEVMYSESGKKGVLTPDSDGYYTVVVGGLNTYNSAGEYYTADKAVELFQESSHLMRRIKNHALYAELGHPKRTPGMSLEHFYTRVISIEETNICGHFSELTLDFKFGEKHPHLNNRNLIGIIGKVKPAGAKANALQLALDNPKQNAAFSIRGLTENKDIGGRVIRTLTNIITFDHVTEPGINIADKHMSPTLESLCVKELNDSYVDRSILRKVITEQNSTMGMENNSSLFNEILKVVDTTKSVKRVHTW